MDEDATRRESTMHRAATMACAAPATHGPLGRRPRGAMEPIRECVSSSVHPSVKEQSRDHSTTITSLAQCDPSAPHTALLMAQELMHYHPTKNSYEVWLECISELVDAACTTPSHDG